MTIAVTTNKTGFDRPWKPITPSGVLRFGHDLDNLFNDILNGEQAFDRMVFSTASQKNISSGSITAPTLALHTVNGETSTDDLDTIGAANLRFVVLKAAAGDTITLRHGMGNIYSLSGANVILTGNRAALLWGLDNTWGIVGVRAVSNNFSATADPGTGDDSADGYGVGSIWVNVTRDRSWICTDPTVATAIWKPIHRWKHEYLIRAASDAINGIGGRQSSTGTLANANDAVNTWVSLTPTSSVDGATAEVCDTVDLITAGYFRPSHDPVIENMLKTGASVADQRLWSGAVLVNNTPGDSSTLAVAFIGFRYDTEASDAGWRPIMCDGSNQTLGAAIGTVVADTVYKLRIRVDSANLRAYFSVNDSAETVVSANSPAITTEMRNISKLYLTSTNSRAFLFSTMKVLY